MFANLRKANSNFVMFVCLSVRPHGTTRLPLDKFSWFDISVLFENVSRKFNFH